MKCFIYRKYLMPYAEGTLTGDLERSVRDHVSACAGCARELNDLKQTVDVLRRTEYRAMEPSFGLRGRVMARISEQPVRAPWWQNRLQAYSAAAAVLVIFGLVVVAYSPPFFQSSAGNSDVEQAVRSTAVGPRATGGATPPPPGMAAMPAASGAKSSLAIRPAARPGARTTIPGSPIHRSTAPVIAEKSTGDPLSQGIVESRSGPSAFAVQADRAVAADSSAAKAGPPGGIPIPASPMSLAANEPAGATKSTAAAPRMAMNPRSRGPQGPAGAPSMPGGMPGAGGIGGGGGFGGGSGPSAMAAAKQAPMADRMPDASASAKSDVDAPVKSATASEGDSVRLGALRKKADSQPDNEHALIDLFTAYGEDKRFNDQYAVAGKLTRLRPDNAYYWLARGQTAEKASMPKTAVAAYRRAITLKLSGAELAFAKSRIMALSSSRR